MNTDSAKTALRILAASPAKNKIRISIVHDFVSATQKEIASARASGHSWRAIYEAISPHITDETGDPAFSFYTFARRYREIRTKEKEPETPRSLQSTPKKRTFILSNGDEVSQELVDRLAELFVKGFPAKHIAESLNEDGFKPVAGERFTEKNVLTLLELCGSVITKRSPEREAV